MSFEIYMRGVSIHDLSGFIGIVTDCVVSAQTNSYNHVVSI